MTQVIASPSSPSSPINSSSSTSSTPILLTSSALIEADQLVGEVDPNDKNLSDKPSTVLFNHDYILSYNDKSIGKEKSATISNRYAQYLTSWEQEAASQYKTYFFHNGGALCKRYVCWLYFKDKALRCLLCEKYTKTRHSTGEISFYKIASTFPYNFTSFTIRTEILF